ncbi:hypothetical protein VW23_021010 [Devosia insulae DS-56]|uniref:Uncharacterized protein n=1 Tax=Devosia insulae DS-56 TaxID=1116389 RepID=A0A1E5XPG5_9HYPH|nr:hypothetical protein VW23_021010 [Devosia insulae DS-56]
MVTVAGVLPLTCEPSTVLLIEFLSVPDAGRLMEQASPGNGASMAAKATTLAPSRLTGRM